MTTDNRWLFDLEDIVQIHMVCVKCNAAFSVPQDKLKRMPSQCVNCDESFYTRGSKEDEALGRLQSALDAMSRIRGANFKVRFEIAAPHAQILPGA
jgi:hypothetical protein